MRYMSKEGRDLITRHHCNGDWLTAEAALLRHGAAVLVTLPDDFGKAFSSPMTRPDGIAVDLREYRDAYTWLCEQYVTHDFNHIDAMKAALIVQQYPLAIIERVGNKCKALGHFTIPYLAAVLESEGAGAIEELRREQRLNELISQSKPVEVPTKRFPGQLRARLHENAINEEIEKQHDDIRRG